MSFGAWACVPAAPLGGAADLIQYYSKLCVSVLKEFLRRAMLRDDFCNAAVGWRLDCGGSIFFKAECDFPSDRSPLLHRLVSKFRQQPAWLPNPCPKSDSINNRPGVLALLRAAGCAGGCSLLAACSGTGSAASGQVSGNSPAAAADVSESAAVSSGPTIAAPARDGNIAIREEFDAAVRQNSIDAFELFVLRHPDHPLAKEARQRIAQLKGETKGK
jgi:hypothetical protein